MMKDVDHAEQAEVKHAKVRGSPNSTRILEQ
jgi:hypothetical protein